MDGFAGEDRLSEILESFDVASDELQKAGQFKEATEEAFLEDFQPVARSVVKPYFDAVAEMLRDHDHQAEVVVSHGEGPDDPGAAITGVALWFSPRGKPVKMLGRLEARSGQVPHVIVRCEPSRFKVITFEGTIGGVFGGSAGAGVMWDLTDVTEDALSERTVKVVQEALALP